MGEMTDVLGRARLFAERALMERLPRAPVERRAGLQERIAAIRAGRLDTAPEVVSARLALEAQVLARGHD